MKNLKKSFLKKMELRHSRGPILNILFTDYFSKIFWL